LVSRGPLPPQVGEGEAEQHMKIAVIGRVFELGSDRDPGGVGVGTGLGLIASQRVRRREGQAQCGTVPASRCTCAHRSGVMELLEQLAAAPPLSL
jgi:hypothetical protein